MGNVASGPASMMMWRNAQCQPSIVDSVTQGEARTPRPTYQAAQRPCTASLAPTLWRSVQCRVCRLAPSAESISAEVWIGVAVVLLDFVSLFHVSERGCAGLGNEAPR